MLRRDSGFAEKGLGVVPRFAGDIGAGQHACQLFDALAFRQSGNVSMSAVFDHTHMIVRSRRHLRRVGHTDYLCAFGQLSKNAPNGIGRGTADAHIGLVQNQAGQFAALCRDDLDSQIDSRLLSA